jgi:hypothetical protein
VVNGLILTAGYALVISWLWLHGWLHLAFVHTARSRRAAHVLALLVVRQTFDRSGAVRTIRLAEVECRVRQRWRDGRTGRLPVWYTVLLVGLMVVGCTTPRPTLNPHDEGQSSSGPTVHDLQRILDRRSEAVRSRDEGAFLADLDQSNQKLLQHQKMVFANLRQLEFSDFKYIVPDLEGAPRPVSFGSRTYVSKVVEVAKLVTDGGPRGVAPAGTFMLKMANKNGQLWLTEVTAVTWANLKRTKAFAGEDLVLADTPWETTPLRILRVGNVWLAGDHSVPDLDRYIAAARAEVGKVEALWGKRLRFPGYILFFTRDKASWRTWFSIGQIPFLADREGLEVPLQGVRTNGKVYTGQFAGARVLVNLANAELVGDDPQPVMRHELAHAITARATLVPLRAFTEYVQVPTWAIEGFAHWVETLDNPSRLAVSRAAVAAGVSAGKFDGLPPGSKKFHGGPDEGFKYALSASVFRYIEQTKDRDAAVEFAAAVFQMVEAELVRSSRFDRLCARVLGVSTSAAFFNQWASFVRRGG